MSTSIVPEDTCAPCCAACHAHDAAVWVTGIYQSFATGAPYLAILCGTCADALKKPLDEAAVSVLEALEMEFCLPSGADGIHYIRESRPS